ncbi:MAG: DUF6144 family protein [Acidobacteriota bacterium]|nr:DUF6144 family protein [Acidobacteriota bacterium]
MKRKSFLKGAIGVAAAGTLLAGSNAMAQEAAKPDCEKTLAGKNKFLLGWLAAWLGNMKKDLPEAEMVKVIEENGRACAERGGSLGWAKSFNGDIDKFLAAMRKEIGENSARRDGSKITLTYDRCFCPLVGDTSEKLPPEYCLCTRGWTKAVYSAVAGKDVKVDLKSSIKRGDPQCLIEVDLG